MKIRPRDTFDGSIKNIVAKEGRTSSRRSRGSTIQERQWAKILGEVNARRATRRVLREALTLTRSSNMNDANHRDLSPSTECITTEMRELHLKTELLEQLV